MLLPRTLASQLTDASQQDALPQRPWAHVKVLDVEGVIDHRDVFLSDEQHRAGDRLQCCVSRVVSARTGGLSGADGRPGVVTIDVP